MKLLLYTILLIVTNIILIILLIFELANLRGCVRFGGEYLLFFINIYSLTKIIIYTYRK